MVRLPSRRFSAYGQTSPAGRYRAVNSRSGARREGKWKIVIICQIFAAKGPLRFSELERRVEGVNQKMLIQQLKELERNGIVTRTVFPQVPPRVEYALSESGIALGPSIEVLVDWALARRAAEK